MNKRYNILSWTIVAALTSNASLLLTVPMTMQRQSHKPMSAYKEITTFEEYKNAVNGSKPIIIKVYTTTCPNCTAMEGAFNEVALQYSNEALFLNLNANTNDTNLRKVAYTFASKGVPTTVFLLPGGSRGMSPAIGGLSKQELQQQVRDFLAQQKNPSMMQRKPMPAPMPAKTMPASSMRRTSRKPSTCTSCCR